jgi:ribosomal protein S18 acetylase RimI-like enzyme
VFGGQNETMLATHIEPFRFEMATEASRTLARAFVANPLHVVAFGSGQLAKNEAFFRTGLAVMKGPKLVALDGSQILGLIHWVRSPGCQFPGLEKLRMTPAMLAGFGVRSALRVGTWLSTWAKHDPKESHSHLGPIGVDPSAQGRRIGQRLMERYCEELDRTGEPGYLETDRVENVEFYRRFGFEITSAVPVLGVRNYLMWRRAGWSAA